jgi:hypothetical protein
LKLIQKVHYELCSLRSGPSPYSLKGSFGEPAAGFRKACFSMIGGVCRSRGSIGGGV